MDPITQCLALLNASPDLASVELATLIIKPLLEIVRSQNARIIALEQKIAPRCPVKNCNKTYTLKSHVTRHIRDIVARGGVEPLFAEHKAELDKSDAKDRDATDPAEHEGGSFTMRSGVTHPAPASVAGGLQLPDAGLFRFPYHMEREGLETPENPNNLEYQLHTTDQTEGLFDMVPAFGGGVYHGSAGFDFGQMQHLTNYPSFGSESLAYTGNMEQLHRGGIRGELAGPQGYVGSYQNDAQVVGFEFDSDAWQSHNATRDESQQKMRY